MEIDLSEHQILSKGQIPCDQKTNFWPMSQLYEGLKWIQKKILQVSIKLAPDNSEKMMNRFIF